ncbi:hypothetical protein LX32DRAFT_365388 [Colletotrichum zoysiae]|uniref:Uncharacterized protein n=1 Tax=Colletotrichum zoysiae TaxID=1216348 RepID=A0AAD9M0E1_9PEZI|nr:hypothetical protein LX32DRAFT_365388 [Colletotrichum zoysiae]
MGTAVGGKKQIQNSFFISVTLIDVHPNEQAPTMEMEFSTNAMLTREAHPQILQVRFRSSDWRSMLDVGAPIIGHLRVKHMTLSLIPPFLFFLFLLLFFFFSFQRLTSMVPSADSLQSPDSPAVAAYLITYFPS